MIVKKEKQFLVFYLDDGKTVKYDLATCQTIGKSGRVVQNLKSQLKYYSIYQILDSIEDETYRKLLKFVYRKNPSISNVGTLIQRAKNYSHYEQLFSTGIDIADKIDMSIGLPKGLLKLCREHNLQLTQLLQIAYDDDPNMVAHVLSIDCLHLDKRMLVSILTYNTSYHYDGIFKELVRGYNYNVKALVKYLDYLYGYEALDLTGWSGALTELRDYARMARAMSTKYDKYPKNLLTVHKITARNYNRLKEHFDEVAFKNRYNADYEKKIDDYVFIYPKESQDIKDEAVQQGNCVASYIKYVIEGRCDILFMRRANDPESSLVTIEIRNNKVVQAKGRYNREVTMSEAEVITKYNTYLEQLKKGGSKGAA